MAYKLVIEEIGAYITKVANILLAFRAYAIADTAAIEKYSSAAKFIVDYKILKDT